jgi:hypothetical protein
MRMAEHKNAERTDPLSRNSLFQGSCLRADQPPNWHAITGRPLGVGERAALVEALRREFPEIFEAA